MPARTSIEWADYSSNPLKFKLPGKKQPINLCVPVSPGCANCYAAAIQKRFHNVDYAKRVMDKAKPVLVEKELQHILNFKPKPPFKNGRDRAAVFIGDMTDLFGPWVPFDLLDAILAHCALRPDVDWLFLTKHPDLMRCYFEDGRYDIQHAVEKIWFKNDGRTVKFAWPLPHVWLGTSAENQDQADKRVPELIATPAAVRFISYEPALGPLDLTLDGLVCLPCPACKDQPADTETNVVECPACDCTGVGDKWGIHWVIVGGESGAGARECDVEWILSILKQCRAADVPCFVKQAGGNPRDITGNRGPRSPLRLKDPKGGDPSEWPEDLRVRQMPGSPVRPSQIPPERTLR